MVCEVVFVQRSEIKQERMAGFFGIILDVLGCLWRLLQFLILVIFAEIWVLVFRSLIIFFTRVLELIIVFLLHRGRNNLLLRPRLIILVQLLNSIIIDSVLATFFEHFPN